MLCLPVWFPKSPLYPGKAPCCENVSVVSEHPSTLPGCGQGPPTPSCTRTSRGSVGTGLTSLILTILSRSSSPLLLPPSPPGRLLRYLCCSGCLLGNAPSPSHCEIGFGSNSGSHMWMSRLREVKKLAQGHTAVKRQSQDLNQIWLQISDFLLLVTQSFSDYSQ